MKRMMYHALSLFIGLIASNIPSAHANEQNLAGNWYSEEWVWQGRVQHEFLRLSLAHLGEDGSLAASFYRCDRQNGLVLLSDVEGSWSLSDNTISTLYFEKRGYTLSTPQPESYKLEEFSENTLSYTHTDTNYTYNNVRVGDDFKISCADLLG